MRITIAIFAALVLTGFSKPISSSVGARHVFAAESNKKTYTAADYIQDGLVALWDGIENVEWGAHDPETTVWIDLINGIKWTGTDLIVEDDGFVCSGVNTVNGNNTFIFSGLVGPERTREIVIEPITIQFTNDPVMSATGDRSLDFALWATRTPQLVAFFRNGLIFYSATPSELSKVGLAVVNGSNFTSGYVNGILTRRQDVYYAQQGNTVLPYLSGNVVKILSFRVYDRVLTEDEIAYNHMIDQVRFWL